MAVNNLLETIRTRRVVRDFAEETVTREDLLQVLEAARWAPSGGNRRVHRFIAIQDPITIKLIRAVSPGVHGHPTTLVVICIDWAKVARLGCKAHHPGVYIDVGTAAENMLLAAHSLGLGAAPMTSFSKEGVRVILQLPDWLSPELMICLGHPGTLRSSPRRPTKPTKMSLIGWSWGTSVMAAYTIRHADRVHRLLLYASRWQWLRSSPPSGSDEAPLGAYRTLSMEFAKSRWLRGVPEAKKTDVVPREWIEAWATATLATDPVGSRQDPPVLRVPSGSYQDIRDYWIAGKQPYYDPAKITVPTLIVHAEWDAATPTDMAQELFGKLTAAPYKRFVQFGEGTHYMMMEKNRLQLFREVQFFLDE